MTIHTKWHEQIEAEIDPEAMTVTLAVDAAGITEHYVCDMNHIRYSLHMHYHIPKPESGWKPQETFTDEEKAKLRPICETLAMLCGNAFFGNTASFPRQDGVFQDCEWWEQWLPQAHALYESNGGDNGWSGEASFAKTNH